MVSYITNPSQTINWVYPSCCKIPIYMPWMFPDIITYLPEWTIYHNIWDNILRCMKPHRTMPVLWIPYAISVWEGTSSYPHYNYTQRTHNLCQIEDAPFHELSICNKYFGANSISWSHKHNQLILFSGTQCCNHNRCGYKSHSSNGED